MLHHDTPVGGVLDLTARLLDLTVHLMCMLAMSKLLKGTAQHTMCQARGSHWDLKRIPQ